MNNNKIEKLWEELNNQYPMNREEMTIEQEQEFVNRCFDIYEKEGFSKVFVSPYDLFSTSKSYQGKSFKVINRIKPITDIDKGEDTADLETLPMWRIQFEDGYIMAAYPEEIISREIKGSMWRESDKQYLEMIE